VYVQANQAAHYDRIGCRIVSGGATKIYQGASDGGAAWDRYHSGLWEDAVMHKRIDKQTSGEVHYGEVEYCPICSNTIAFKLGKSLFSESILYRNFVRYPEERKYLEPFRHMWE
jgi:hypothetical protein